MSYNAMACHTAQLFFAHVTTTTGDDVGYVTVLEGADTLADATAEAKKLLKARDSRELY